MLTGGVELPVRRPLSRDQQIRGGSLHLLSPPASQESQHHQQTTRTPLAARPLGYSGEQLEQLGNNNNNYNNNNNSYNYYH